MDDKKLPLAVGGGTAALVLLAAVSALSDKPESPAVVADATEMVQEVADGAGDTAATATETVTEEVVDAAEAVAETAETVAEEVTDTVADGASEMAEAAEDAVEAMTGDATATDTAEAPVAETDGAGDAVADADPETMDAETAQAPDTEAEPVAAETETAETPEADAAEAETAEAPVAETDGAGDAVADADPETMDADSAESEPVMAETEAAEQETAGAAAMDFAALTPEQTEAFGDQVRAYLLSNPMVLQEVVARLEEAEAANRSATDTALVAANSGALFDDGFSYVGGNPDGDITIVEFMDYRCGFCRRASPEVEQLLQSDGDIRLIVKEFPILGEASLISSQFAIATLIVEGPEAYKGVHDALMTLEGEPSEAVLSRLGSMLDLDVDTIFAEMTSDEVMQRISQTRQLAQAMQISGTPTFVFGNQMVRGYAPLDAMQQIVAEERDAQ